jgi:glutathione S-transferase
MGGASSSKRPKPPSQPLELYAGKLSPPSRAVWLYILQNNLPIDVHEIDILKGETKTDEFTKLNPHQAVPVLKDRDVVVRESQAIIRYLAHRYTNFAGLGASTSPKNPNWEETSKIDATVCWLHTTFYPDVFDNFVKPSILPALPEGVKEAVIEIGEKNTKKHLDTLEKVYFEGKDFLCGGQPTVADIFGGVFMSVLELKKDFDLSAWPKVINSIPNITCFILQHTCMLIFFRFQHGFYE